MRPFFSRYFHSEVQKNAAPAWEQPPEARRNGKEYPRFPHITLPPPETTGPFSLTHALSARISAPMSGALKPISVQTLSTLLKLSLGVREDGKAPHPSGGGLYPIETYVIVQQAEGVAPGTYHYNRHKHVLEHLPRHEKITALVRPINVPFAEHANVAILFTASWQKNTWKYGEMSYQLSLLEAGHCMQNVLLLGTELRLQMRPLAGIIDDSLYTLLDIEPHHETPLYMCLIGS